MKKITLAKPAKDISSSVVLYVYTREGGAGCGCLPPVSNYGCSCNIGKGCDNNNIGCRS